MFNKYNRLSNFFFFYFILFFGLLPVNTFAQLVTNGNFEISDTGIVDSSDVEGWLIEVAEEINPLPIFEIVSDSVKEGNRALKISVQGLGTNEWDIQAIADSIPVEHADTYNYSVWAKAKDSGAKVNFTVGDYSYSEIKAIRPANLTTQWQEYTMQFTINGTIDHVRAPIHFNYEENSGNDIYIDNLQIFSVNFGKTPVIVEAESGTIGSKFSVQQDGDITYVTTDTNHTGSAAPGDTNIIITYQVEFKDSGSYNLFVRLRVGSGTYNDDSFFYGNGFGEKNDTAGADWIFVNGLATAGFSDSSDFVDDQGAIGSEVWKWVNLTKNAYDGETGSSFYVSIDSLSKTFQIGSREDGLDIDKIAFGKSDLYYTVKDLDNGLPGSVTLDDTISVYQGPPLAEGQAKFLGCCYGSITDTVFANYWTQLTPENGGKWGSVAGSSDTSNWNWSALDLAYNYAKENDLIFKDHTLIWGQQQPYWINSLDSAEQISYIETWIEMVGERYPEMDMIDVVNEPLHAPPSYIEALGGNGETGWDWVIKSFELAKDYLPPNTKLLINDYNIINSSSSTSNYLQIINLLKDRELIDGIGVQGHRFELENTDSTILKNNLDSLAATGLPIYISEMDLGNINDTGEPNDAQQLQLYESIFPILWEHPGVKGITLWGYREYRTWQETCFLVRDDGTWRPALDWLAQYLEGSGINEPVSVFTANYRLKQNYPNPFNKSTRIDFEIPEESFVSLKVYNILGQEVAVLTGKKFSAGAHSVTFEASNLAGGMYFYKIKARDTDFAETKKMILIR
jgi:endo-1,4-beta-xylanase